MQFIDLKRQYQLYKEEIDNAIHEVLEGCNFIMGHQVKTLEEKLAAFVGVKHCITVSSGTDSLLIILMGLGIGSGDEVITTPFTMISPAEVVALLGATPVFADIDPETLNLDVNQIKKAITPKTKAIMPISLYGQMPDLDAINALGKKHNIPVIEDGAQSFGATQNGRKSCGVTTAGSTSFFPAKPFGCYGDGGAIFTNDDALAAKMRAIRTHGGEKRYCHQYPGLNGRFDTIQAAVLLAKLPHFPGEIEARQRIGVRYTELLKSSCQVLKTFPGNTHVYAQYTIRVPNRDALAQELQEQGVPTAIHYPRGNQEQPVFEHLNYPKGSLPETEQACKEVISLPMHPWLTEEEQDLIVNAVKKSVVAHAV